VQGYEKYKNLEGNYGSVEIYHTEHQDHYGKHGEPTLLSQRVWATAVSCTGPESM
jgi:hypothetical protein